MQHYCERWNEHGSKKWETKMSTVEKLAVKRDIWPWWVFTMLTSFMSKLHLHATNTGHSKKVKKRTKFWFNKQQKSSHSIFTLHNTTHTSSSSSSSSWWNRKRMRMNEVMEISLEKQQTRWDVCRESVKTMSYSSTINLQLDTLHFSTPTQRCRHHADT